jgi:hypothetical protein
MKSINTWTKIKSKLNGDFAARLKSKELIM